MNRLLAPALVLLLAFAVGASPSTSVNIQVQDHGNSGLSLDFQLPTIAQMTIDPGSNIESYSYTSDNKEIPIVRRWIRIPPGHRVEVDINNRSSCLYKDIDKYDVINRLSVNSEQLTHLELFPPEPVSVGGTIIFRGMPITPITVYPVQFDQSRNSVVENTDISLNISFIPDASINRSVNPVNDPPGSEMARVIDQLLLNPPRRDYDEIQVSFLARILIIHDTSLSRAAELSIAEFAEWKRQMGYQVDIEAIEDAVGMGSADIRELIRDNYYNVDPPEIPISHLIIIGQDTIQNRSYFPSERDLGDHYFSLMDGDEILGPDITVGRFYIDGDAQLEAAFNRSILYESDPYIDDEEDINDSWYSKAIFTAEDIGAQGGELVASMFQLGRWTHDRLMRFSDPPYTWVDTLYARPNDNEGVVQETQEALEDGRSLALSRGWLLGSMIDMSEDRATYTGRKHPFVCAVTCHSGRRQAAFFHSGTPRVPNGPIAVYAMFGPTNTKTNQSILGWIVRAITYRKMNQPGLIQLVSKINFAADFRYDKHVTEGIVIPTLMVYRLLGDPSVNVFTRYPVQLEAEYPETVTLGATGLNILVDSEEGLYADATVCISQPDNEVHLVTFPGDDGWARFTFASGYLEEGELLLTITRPNTLPVIDAINVQAQNVMIELDNFSIDDEDDKFGSGETLPTTLTFSNNGNEDVQDLSIVLSTEDPWVTFSEDRLSLQEIPEGEDREIEFEMYIHESSKAYRLVRIGVEVEAGDSRWSHSFTFPTAGHLLADRRIRFGDDQTFDPGQTVDLIPVLTNHGDLRLEEFSATLISLNDDITVIEDSVEYPPIDPRPDEGYAPIDNSAFRVELDTIAIPGDSARFRLDLFAGNDDEDFRDTIYFQELIGQPDVRDPFGPDEYGYICFDSGDEGWGDRTPVYDWIEINTSEEDNNFMGTRLDFRDYLEEQDDSAVLELPFSFRYYGQQFDTLIVCTNGWIAFGNDNSKYHTFRNWSIPGIQGPDAQIAVMWQDLVITSPTNARGVYYYYDEDNGRFIVEWSNMQLFHGDNRPADDHLVEFQVILYDPSIYHSSTGDGDIKIQYKTFEDFRGISHDNQFSTIGLKNLDNTGGLQYVYWSEYSDRCMELVDETALFFTMDVILEYGGLAGRAVVADDTSQTLEGVRVYTRRGYETLTDDNGRFEFDDIAAGREEVFFALDDYNTMSARVDIFPDSTTQIGMQMTYPLIRLSDDPIRGEARPDSGCGGQLIDVYNDGIGDLEYSVSRRYRDGSDTEYEQISEIGVGEILDVPYLFGCQFVEDEVFVTYTEDLGQVGSERISVFNRNNQLVRSFEQPSYQSFGFMDLAYDGTYLYGGDLREDTVVLVQFDTNGDRVRDIDVPLSVNDFPFARALAWRPETETIFMAHDLHRIYEMNMDARIVDSFYVDLPDGRPSIKGMAWNPVDDDNMPLYIMDWAANDTNRRMRLIKVNPYTRRSEVLGDISILDQDKGKGLSIGFNWEQGVACLASIADKSNRFNEDMLRIYEIGPDTRFLIVNIGDGIVQPNGESPITVIMSALGLEDGQEFEMGLVINHNARGEEVVVPIEFRVNARSNINGNVSIPLEFGLDNAYPNPFNSMTRIGYSLDIAGITTLKIYDITGREVAVLIDNEMPAGKHNVLFESENFASGIYFYRLESGMDSQVKRMVLLR
ncbi:MAG: C25 family cysteine peptidase [Candidatus Hatepunaea meridiana]|nr:C25 family cysteine peptidase [Candidatus Hatepunaea meridiana]